MYVTAATNEQRHTRWLPATRTARQVPTQTVIHGKYFMFFNDNFSTGKTSLDTSRRAPQQDHHRHRLFALTMLILHHLTAPTSRLCDAMSWGGEERKKTGTGYTRYNAFSNCGNPEKTARFCFAAIVYLYLYSSGVPGTVREAYQALALSHGHVTPMVSPPWEPYPERKRKLEERARRPKNKQGRPKSEKKHGRKRNPETDSSYSSSGSEAPNSSIPREETAHAEYHQHHTHGTYRKDGHVRVRPEDCWCLRDGGCGDEDGCCGEDFPAGIAGCPCFERLSAVHVLEVRKLDPVTNVNSVGLFLRRISCCSSGRLSR